MPNDTVFGGAQRHSEAHNHRTRSHKPPRAQICRHAMIMLALLEIGCIEGQYTRSASDGRYIESATSYAPSPMPRLLRMIARTGGGAVAVESAASVSSTSAAPVTGDGFLRLRFTWEEHGTLA